VLIGGLPAARAGDIGLHPTCGGFAPFFQIKTGSSNTFIGGSRAARMLDLGGGCEPGENRNMSQAAGRLAGAVGTIARLMIAAQTAAQVGQMASDLAEAAVNDDAAMGAAQAMAAGMAAAQMAADIAASALTKAMGTDPGMPAVSTKGMVMMGAPNVLIGGFPMPNFPDPAQLLLGRLARYRRGKPKKKNGDRGQAGPRGCPA
jgi:uncharacterized Zn-binding protein involved in type VI secretion